MSQDGKFTQNKSVIDYMLKEQQQLKGESDWRFKQRCVKLAEKHLHSYAMANGYKTQYVKQANRVGHLSNGKNAK